jgi:hypothetical protein
MQPLPTVHTIYASTRYLFIYLFKKPNDKSNRINNLTINAIVDLKATYTQRCAAAAAARLTSSKSMLRKQNKWS